MLETKHLLFTSYVSTMMQRKARRDEGIHYDHKDETKHPTEYKEKSIYHNLGWLALRLSERSENTFSLDELYSFMGRKKDKIWRERIKNPYHITNSLLIFIFTFLIGVLIAPNNITSLGIVGLIGVTASLFSLTNGIKSDPEINARISLIVIFDILLISIISLLPFQVNLFPFSGIILIVFLSFTYSIRKENEFKDIHALSKKERWFYLGLTLMSVLISCAILYFNKNYAEKTVYNMFEVVLGEEGFDFLYKPTHVIDWFIFIMMSFTQIFYFFIKDRENGSMYMLTGILHGTPAIVIPITLIENPYWYWVISAIAILFVSFLIIVQDRFFILGIPTGALTGAFMAGSAGVLPGAMTIGVLFAWFVDASNKPEKYCFNHFVMFILKLTHCLPLRHKAFLEYCIETKLLKKSDDGYEFIHHRVRDHFATAKLMPILQNGTVYERVQAIGKLSLQGEAAFDSLKDLTDDSEAEIREAAVKGLGRFGKADEVVPIMLKALDDEDLRVRKAAISNTEKFPAEIAEPVLNAALQDDNICVICQVLLVLKKNILLKRLISDRDLLNDRCLSAMEGKDAICRKNAAIRFTWSECKDEKVINGLTEILQHSDPLICKDAVKVLGFLCRNQRDSYIISEIRESTVIPALRKLLDDNDKMVRLALIEALDNVTSYNNFKDSSFFGDLTILLKDKEPEVRAKAAMKLYIKGGTSVVDYLTMDGLKTALKTGEDYTRKYAAQYMGEIGWSSTIPALKIALKDKKRFVRKEAAEAIKKIEKPLANNN